MYLLSSMVKMPPPSKAEIKSNALKVGIVIAVVLTIYFGIYRKPIPLDVIKRVDRIEFATVNWSGINSGLLDESNGYEPGKLYYYTKGMEYFDEYIMNVSKIRGRPLTTPGFGHYTYIVWLYYDDKVMTIECNNNYIRVDGKDYKLFSGYSFPLMPAY